MLLLLMIISWIPLCLIVGAYGSHRNIGFWGGFIASLFFSPLIGFICVALSDRKVYHQPKQQQEDGFDIDKYRIN
jgi:Na+-driven multidrug efflux pump